MKKKKFINLDKKWKELVYAMAGIGPNLLMVLMGAYFTDAVNPAALGSNTLQTITGTCLITPALFSILWFVGKVFDGIVDVPLAAVTDNLHTKWGKRRLPIAICFIPMVLAYILCWIPLTASNEMANTIWIFVWSLIFFTTYTMSLIAFYGSLSTVCASESQRLRVSSYKAFFDTISYCIVYALVPVLLGAFNIHIDKLVFILCPLMLTMLIPVFMIKEGEKWEKKAIKEGYDITPLAEEKKVPILESIKLTFKNKEFMKWCLVNCCSFFGLQMFLVAMNAMIVGGMGLTNVQMAILNTCAFGPVPLMLYLFNKAKAKYGIRPVYQSCLIAFAIGILSFLFGSSYVMGDNTTLKMIIGIIGGIFGSWAIGPFFMMGYMIPAQISSVEEKLTKKNHSAMYFAAQALTTTVVGAVASSLVYENIKMLFISKTNKAIVYASVTGGEKALDVAANLLKTDASNVFNFGTLLVPVIVFLFCLLGFFIAFLMPKNYTPKDVAKKLGLEKEYEKNKDLFNEEDETSVNDKKPIGVNIGLWLLTGSIFGIFWRYDLTKEVNAFAKKKVHIIHYIISILVFPYSAYIMFRLSKEIAKKYKCADLSILNAILSLIGLEIVAMIILQSKLNKQHQGK